MEVEFNSLAKELAIPANFDDLTDSIEKKNNDIKEMEEAWEIEKVNLLAKT